MYLQCLIVFVLCYFVCGNAKLQLQYTIDNIKETSIQISWNPPQNYSLPNLRGYTVLHSKHGQLLTTWVEAEQFYVTHVFAELKPFTKYSFSIVPEFRDIAKAIWPANIEAVTLPSVGQPVKHLHYTHIGYEDIKVAWTAPDEPYGEIEFYQVEYSDWIIRRADTVQVSTTGTKLLKLHASTTYSISIRTRNKQVNGHGGGLGDAVTGIFTTKAVVQLQHTIDNIKESSIQISWNPPKNYPPSDILWYSVALHGTNHFRSITVGSKQFRVTHTIKNLKPFTKYSITIISNVKDAATAILPATMEAVTLPSVGQKVLNLTLTAKDPRSVHATWRPPSEPLGIIEAFEISAVNKHTGREMVYGSKESSITLTGLDPSTTYTIFVSVRNKKGEHDNLPLEQTDGGGGLGERVSGEVDTLSLDAEIPNDVRAVALSSQNIQVTWKRPNYNLSDEEGYKLELVGQDFRNAVLVGTDVFSHTFSGLEPLTEYTIYVQVNDRIPGVLRQRQQISMSTWPADADIPNHVRALALSSQSVQVTWKTPNYTLSDKDGYTVMAVVQDLNKTIFVGKDVSSHTFYDLQPNTEYTFYVQVKDRIPGVLHPSGQISRRTWPAAQKACGKQTFAPAAWPATQSTKREATLHSWPWTVGLYTSTRGAYPFCGGTLIAPDWIITAAHCVEMAMNCIVPPVGVQFTYETYANAILFARIGDHDLKKTEKSERDRLVQSIIMHPNFSIESGSSEHDIALLRLHKAVVADDAIDFVCLPRQDSVVPLSKECTFASWGAPPRLSTLPYKNSPVLMEGRLILETKDFSDLNGHERQSDGQACFRSSAFNPCWGDNGAGVNCVDAQGQWILYGIINSGSFLCTGQNATSTKILPHLDWIKKAIETKEFV